MKYFKNKQNELFIDPIVENHIGLEELTKEEFDAQLAENNIPTAEQLYSTWKESRKLAVESIEVIYDQVVYQGDEISQGRMSRSIAALPDDVMTVLWIAKDNSVHPLNKAQLKAILLDAGTKQSAIWNEGRPL